MAVASKAGKTKPQKKEASGPVEIKTLWRDDQTPPNLSMYGSNWILVEAPISDEELDREYCEISHTPPGSTETVLDSGDIGYPFDGATFLMTNLASGTHTFTATAQYEGEDDSISKSNGRVIALAGKGRASKQPAAAASKAVSPTGLVNAPQILKQSSRTSPNKWVLLQAPEFPEVVQQGRRKFTFQRGMIVRRWTTSGGREKRAVVAMTTTCAAQPVLDNRRNLAPVAGAVYRAIGIYGNKRAPAGEKQHRLKSSDSTPVQFS